MLLVIKPHGTCTGTYTCMHARTYTYMHARTCACAHIHTDVPFLLPIRNCYALFVKPGVHLVS